jgi:hypothetical protein
MSPWENPFAAGPPVPAIDVACWCGAFAERHVPHSEPADLDALAGRLGIERAIVSPFSALSRPGVLASWPEQRDAFSAWKRLEPWPVVEPARRGELKRLEAICRQGGREAGPRGVRLLPGCHGYDLADGACGELASLAAERGLIVQVFQRLGDERLSWMRRFPPVPIDAMEAFAAAHPEPAMIFSGVNGAACEPGCLAAAPRLHLDLSRVRGPVFAVERLLERVPVERLLLGTLWPLQLAEATLWQVQAARIPEEDREAILAGNARRLLAEPGG